MSSREVLNEVLSLLPESRLQQVAEYAQFLASQDERADWQRFGQGQLARAYGAEEPEYTEADVKSDG